MSLVQRMVRKMLGRLLERMPIKQALISQLAQYITAEISILQLFQGRSKNKMAILIVDMVLMLSLVIQQRLGQNKLGNLQLRHKRKKNHPKQVQIFLIVLIIWFQVQLMEAKSNLISMKSEHSES